MKIHQISLKNHKKHKTALLDLIDQCPNVPISGKGETVDKSDWFLSQGYERHYWNYFANNLLEPFYTKMNKTYKGSTKIKNYWFHQYTTKDYYGWHTHPDSHFSSVYYLELSRQELVTEFKDLPTIKAKEGDIITFPAYLIHKSPINLTKTRKTVIVFNSSIWP